MLSPHGDKRPQDVVSVPTEYIQSIFAAKMMPEKSHQKSKGFTKSNGESKRIPELVGLQQMVNSFEESYGNEPALADGRRPEMQNWKSSILSCYFLGRNETRRSGFVSI